MIPPVNTGQASDYAAELRKMEEDLSHHDSKRLCPGKSKEIPLKAKQGSPFAARPEKGDFRAPDPDDEAAARRRSEKGKGLGIGQLGICCPCPVRAVE